MKYRESHKDKKLRSWFSTDMTRGLLRRIRLASGAMRGLSTLDISFEYPITAIAGKNGAGKSTILALACCAFHNHPSGFKLPKRNNSYYTFSDFFVQHTEETSPQGLTINYQIAHNNWKKTADLPEGIGLGWQIRKKTKGGKWNDYDTRAKRTVVFLGIERIVPHSERSQSRSYSRVFKNAPAKGWESKVMDAVGFILCKSYDDFRYVEHSKYSLPIVKSNTILYSGFNMGAGENALFEIFSSIYSAGSGALLVMDEIELGLHAEAQQRFMDKLKDICLEMHAQIICTTHSTEIFECLPPDARFYIESVNGKTRVTQGISSDFAFTKLSSITGLELDVFVEDDVARSILLSSLSAPMRSRINITIIGSATALARQLSALYVRGETKPILAIFDGDQRSKEGDNLGHAAKMAEKIDAQFPNWFKGHICYLPGDTWPEAWILQRATNHLEPLAALLGTECDQLSDIIEYGLQAGKHNEFHEISKHLGLERSSCLQVFTSIICPSYPEEVASISKTITAILTNNS